MSRRHGFTLIELLVVIAIIAILAAMLSPVFARARESARKIQCLSNVKNIAIAIQMYLTDYDRFPPDASGDAAALEYFATEPGRGGGGDNPDCWRIGWANPFVRWPVVLDEYTRNREVWRCPSSKMSVGTFFIVPHYTSQWWRYLQDHEGEWGTGKVVSPCAWGYPPGWGGSVTDSIAQQRLAMAEPSGWITGEGQASGGFDPGISCSSVMDTGMKTSQITDPSWHVVCGDNGCMPVLHTLTRTLYSACGIMWGCADWTNCPWTVDCGLDASMWETFKEDASYRATFTRHMGGSNLGFADGHAAWMHAEQIRVNHPHQECCTAESGYTAGFYSETGKMEGMCPCW